MNTIGVRLRELRQSAKLSQAKIASVYKGIHIKTTKNGLPTY